MDIDDEEPDEGGVVRSSDAALTSFVAIAAHYRLELQLFWQRANTHLLVQGVLLTFGGVLYGSERDGRDVFPVWIQVGFSCFGLSLTLVWWAVLCAANDWKRRWRREVIKLDSELNPFRSYEASEGVRQRRPGFLSARYEVKAEGGEGASRFIFSPERLTLLLPGVFAVAWVTLGGYAAFG